MAKIIETKVVVGAAAGGIGGALGSFLLWLLGVTIWHAPAAAGSADAATAAVPAPVAGLLLTVLPAVLALIGGWLAPHTHRPDLETPVPELAPPAAPAAVTTAHDLIGYPAAAADTPPAA